MNMKTAYIYMFMMTTYIYIYMIKMTAHYELKAQV